MVKYGIRVEEINGVQNTRYHIFIDTNIAEVHEYRKELTILREANDGDEVFLYVNSYGGYLDTAIQFIYALEDTAAKTKAVIYTAASAATLIAFACDEVDAKPLSTVMLHNFSTHQQGKGSEIRAKVKFDEAQFGALCTTLYSGILSEVEIKKLQDDDDFWFIGGELHTRMEKYGWESLRK